MPATILPNHGQTEIPHAPATTAKAVSLATVWPRPKFREAAMLGRDAVAQSILYMVVYDNLRRSPVHWREGDRGLTIDFWAEQYVRGVGFIRTAWETRSPHTLASLAQAFSRYMRDGLRSEVERSFATSAVSKGRVVPDSMPTDLPPHLLMRKSSLAAMGWPADMDIPDDAKVGVVKVDGAIRGYERGYYPSLAVLGSNRVVPLRQEPFASRSGAIGAAIKEQKDLNQRNLVRGGTPTLVYRREGYDWRGGADVSEAVLVSMFDFKGLEFGKSITPAEQQSFVNALYDACMDLCSVMESSPHAASCFGRLGIAFGSQGRGAATGAATFDAETWQMHLTKSRGGGALCHEYGHTLDALLFDVLIDGDKVPPNAQYISDIMALHHDDSGTYTLTSAVLPLLKSSRNLRTLQLLDDLYENLFSRRREDSFFTRSEEMDYRQSCIYWSTPRELFARAFETYALDRLTTAGMYNDFLVRHVDNYRRESEGFADSIFPQGYQRLEFAQQFAKLHSELKLVDLA